MQSGDGQLLEQFFQNRDEFAFEELIKRHAHMVMAVCKWVLKDTRDVEEAFQNTFMVLIRKGGKLLKTECIHGWLYQVAFREALKARNTRLTQAKHFVEQEDMDMIAQPEESPAKIWETIKPLIAEELDRLAEKYRLPLILCYIDGKNTGEAALELGLNHTAFRMRLTRGREMLRKRLTRRGMAVSGSLLNTVLMAQVAQSAETVSEVLIQSTVKAAAALLPAAAGAGAGTVTLTMQLLKGALAVMTYKTTTLVIGGLVLVGVLGSIPFLMKHSKQQVVQVSEQKAVVPTKPKSKVEENTKTIPSQAARSPQPAGNVISAATNVASSHNPTNSFPLLSLNDFSKLFSKAMGLSESAQRWQALREIGLNLSDEDFTQAENMAKKYLEILAKKYPYKIFDTETADMVFENAIFNVWLGKDPVAFANWTYQLSKLPGGDMTCMLATPKSMIFNEGNYKYQIDSCCSGGAKVAKTLLSSTLHKWAVLDSQAASAWANNLPDGSERQSALKAIDLGKKISVVLMNPNPADTLNTIVSQFSNDEIFDASGEIGAIASRWMQTDPQTVSVWPGQYSYSNNRIGWAMMKCYETWADNDLPSASDWMMETFNNPDLFYTKPPYTNRDNGVFYTERDSAGVLYVAAILGSWYAQDPQSAGAWLEQQRLRNDLTDTQKSTINQWIQIFKNGKWH